MTIDRIVSSRCERRLRCIAVYAIAALAIPLASVRAEEQATPPVGYHSEETLTESSLTPPVRIIASAAAGDGGTLYLKLIGDNNRLLTLSLTQNKINVLVPGHTLFLDVSMTVPGEPGEPDDESSAHLRERLPRSQDEVAALFAILTNACEDTESPSRVIVESIVRSLRAKKKIDVWDGVSDAKPKWFAEYEIERAAGEARAAEYDRREAVAMQPFPTKLRKLLERSRREPYEDHELAARASALCAGFADDERMVHAICHAYGALEEARWGGWDERDEIVNRALALTEPYALSTAIDEMTAGESAANALARRGAMQILFDPDFDYLRNFEEPEIQTILPRLMSSEFRTLSREQQALVVDALSSQEGPAATTLLRRLARGEIAVAESGELSDREISAPDRACLALACRNDREIEPIVRQRLEAAKRPIDRAALEVSLANLGDHERLNGSCFEFHSVPLEMAALRAIKQFAGKHGMELLMSPLVLGRESLVSEEGVALACTLTGQRWQPSEETIRSGDYDRDAAEWWQAHRHEFEGE